MTDLVDAKPLLQHLEKVTVDRDRRFISCNREAGIRALRHGKRFAREFGSRMDNLAVTVKLAGDDASRVPGTVWAEQVAPTMKRCFHLLLGIYRLNGVRFVSLQGRDMASFGGVVCEYGPHPGHTRPIAWVVGEATGLWWGSGNSCQCQITPLFSLFGYDGVFNTKTHEYISRGLTLFEMRFEQMQKPIPPDATTPHIPWRNG